MQQDEKEPEPGDRGFLVTMVLPTFNSTMGFSCAKEWCEEHTSHQCACPNCLEKQGLTLCYRPQDWNESGDLQEMWGKRIVSLKTARLCTHLICADYPGAK